MPLARVTFDPRRDHVVTVQGHGELRFRNEQLVGPKEVLWPASLTSLRDALTKYLRYVGAESGEGIRLPLSLAPAGKFDRDFGPFQPVSILVRQNALFVEVESLRERPANEADDDQRVLGPLLARERSELVDVDVHDYDEAHLLRVVIAWPFTRRSVDALWRFGMGVHTLLEAASGSGDLTMWTALELLRAGRWDLLRGHPETDWLDAKQRPYDATNPNWRFELAKDVAAFANSVGGGLIVLGMSTRDDGGGDTITGHHEFALGTLRRQTYRNVVAQHVYPRVEGFEVERLEGTVKDQGLVVLVIPPQSETNRPFLVYGVVRQRSVLGAHVLVPFRREDETAHLDPAAIHARIRLGEQLIAGRLSSR